MSALVPMPETLKLTEFVDTEVSTEMKGGDAVDRTRAL